jgi:biopolymer transport protein ExbD
MMSLKGRGKGKEHINNLNLVPFIDLFSTMILFLMSTAVFDQLASLPVNMGTEETSTVKVPEGSPQGKKITSTVAVSINESDIVLTDAGNSKRVSLDTVQKSSFLEVSEFMREARGRHEALREIVINATDKAKYGNIAVVMDKALAEDFDQLIVTGEVTQ